MADLSLCEQFDSPQLHERLQWFQEPAQWTVDTTRACLRIETQAATDFWQRTHYGFQADNGHFLAARVAGDFVMQTHLASYPAHQYDQAGLMVRVSPECWLKTSIEFEPNWPSRLGVVVTNQGYSDWSTQDVLEVAEIHLRVRRHGADYKVEASFNGRDWTQLRLAHLDHEPNGAVHCGIYACSPKGAGFAAEFNTLEIATASAD
jgi:uncharacterized protein